MFFSSHLISIGFANFTAKEDYPLNFIKGKLCTQFLVSPWVEGSGPGLQVGTDKFSLQPKLIVISLAILGEIFNQIFYFSIK